MNRIQRIGLEGIADFKKSVLAIQPGVTYLYGKNMLEAGNGNAAGKSVFASAPADIFYDTPMVGTKQDRPKQGTRFIEFVRNKKQIRITSKYEGARENLSIFVDGEKKKGRTATMTRKLLPKYWPLSEEDYRTYGYLDASLPHPLVRGDSKSRKAFFTSFFQLDRLDAEKKVLLAKRNELKKVRARFTELNATFLAVKSDMLGRAEREALEAEVGELEKQLKKLRSKSDTAQRAKRLMEFERFASAQIKALKKAVPDLATFEDEYKRVRKELRKAEDAAEAMELYRSYKRDLKRWEEKRAEIDTKLTLDELQEARDKYLKFQAELEAMDLGDKPKMPEVVELPLMELEEAQRLKGVYSHQLKHAKKFADGVCGECGQPVKAQDPKKVKRKLEEASAVIEAHEAFIRYTRKIDEYKVKKAEYGRLSERAANLKVFIEKLAGKAKLFRAMEALGRKPEAVERPEDVGDITALKKTHDLLEFCSSHLETLRDLEGLPPEHRELSFDPDKVDAVQDKLSKKRTRLEVHQTVKGRASDMRERLKALEEELADDEVINFVLEAYDDRAVKKMAIEAISEQLMATVNHIARDVFPTYSFSFLWTTTNIQLLVHRPKKGTTDVRKLSGAESRLFTLILVCALMMFVPASKRLNLLELDEPTASFSEQTTVKFHALLPHLLKIIPSILIMTPRASERLKGAHEYTVFRDETGATIKKGHPDEI